MFGVAQLISEMRCLEEMAAQHERRMYEFGLIRGPMIEADIDWRVPLPCRSMVEGDIGKAM